MALIDDKTDGLVLEILDIEDDIGTWIEKQNYNFRTISQHGGGPKGPIGPQGVPGCPGMQGPPGPNGENASDEWSSETSYGCNSEELHNLDDVIINKWANKSLILTNLVDADNRVELRENDVEERTFKWTVNEFKDSKLKIINSNLLGKGDHIALANSKAIQMNPSFLCKSGISISLDYFIDNEETLRIIGNKNSNVVDHKHILEFSLDRIDLKRNVNSQSLSFDSYVETQSDNKGLFELVELTENRKYNIPDRSGFVGIWQNTLQNSEIWETIQTDNIVCNRFRYSNNTGYHELQEGELAWVTLLPGSNIRFKRLNNFVIIDYHIGLDHILDHGDFILENIQFVINRETVACGTQGWYPGVVLQDEKYVPLDKNSLSDNLLFTITPTQNNSFFISIRFLNDRGLHFTESEKETYWLSGQIWATVQSAETECIILDIDQNDECIVIDIEGPDDISTSGTSSTGSLNYELLDDWIISWDYINGTYESVDCEALKNLRRFGEDKTEYDIISDTLQNMQARYVYWHMPNLENSTKCYGVIAKLYMYRDRNGKIECQKINNTYGDCGTASTSSQVICETITATTENSSIDVPGGFRVDLPIETQAYLTDNQWLIENTIIQDLTNTINNEPITLVPYRDYWLTNYAFRISQYYKYRNNVNIGNQFKLCYGKYVPGLDSYTWNEKFTYTIIPEIFNEIVIQNNKKYYITKRKYTQEAYNINAVVVEIPEIYKIKEVVYCKNLNTNFTYLDPSHYTIWNYFKIKQYSNLYVENSELPDTTFEGIWMHPEHASPYLPINIDDVIEVKFEIIPR